jgi:hypothetical protein
MCGIVRWRFWLWSVSYWVTSDCVYFNFKFNHGWIFISYMWVVHFYFSYDCIFVEINITEASNICNIMYFWLLCMFVEPWHVYRNTYGTVNTLSGVTRVFRWIVHSLLLSSLFNNYLSKNLILVHLLWLCTQGIRNRFWTVFIIQLPCCRQLFKKYVTLCNDWSFIIIFKIAALANSCPHPHTVLFKIYYVSTCVCINVCTCTCTHTRESSLYLTLEVFLPTSWCISPNFPCMKCASPISF